MAKAAGWTVALEQVVCGACGVTHAVPVVLMDTRREKGGSLWCPNGHEERFPAAVAEQPPAPPVKRRKPARRPPGRLKDAEKGALAALVAVPAGLTLEKLAAQLGVGTEAARAAVRGLKQRHLAHGERGLWKATQHGRELVPTPREQPAPVH